MVIGASSGGPQALENVLGKLPRSFPVPIVIVQHVDEAFVTELTAWLDSITKLKVKLASENELLMNEKSNLLEIEELKEEISELLLCFKVEDLV